MAKVIISTSLEADMQITAEVIGKKVLCFMLSTHSIIYLFADTGGVYKMGVHPCMVFSKEFYSEGVLTWKKSS